MRERILLVFASSLLYKLINHTLQKMTIDYILFSNDCSRILCTSIPLIHLISNKYYLCVVNRLVVSIPTVRSDFNFE